MKIVFMVCEELSKNVWKAKNVKEYVLNDSTWNRPTWSVANNSHRLKSNIFQRVSTKAPSLVKYHHYSGSKTILLPQNFKRAGESHGEDMLRKSPNLWIPFILNFSNSENFRKLSVSSFSGKSSNLIFPSAPQTPDLPFPWLGKCACVCVCVRLKKAPLKPWRS